MRNIVYDNGKKICSFRHGAQQHYEANAEGRVYSSFYQRAFVEKF